MMTDLIQKGTATCRPLKPTDFVQLVIMMNEMNLTRSTAQTKMTAPQNIEVGFSSSFKVGDNSPLSIVVFLRQKFTHLTNLLSELFIMTALRWRPLWSVVPTCDTANQFNAVTRFLAVLRDGFTLQKVGIHQ